MFSSRKHFATKTFIAKINIPIIGRTNNTRNDATTEIFASNIFQVKHTITDLKIKWYGIKRVETILLTKLRTEKMLTIWV